MGRNALAPPRHAPSGALPREVSSGRRGWAVWTGLCLMAAVLWCGVVAYTCAAQSNASLSERVRQADDYYLGRLHLENVRKALDLVREALTQDPKDYEAWWRISKFTCYMARRTKSSEKMKFLQEGIEAGKRAVALEPLRPEGHFWLGANEGLMAEARGFLRGVLMLDSIRKEMETVTRLDPDYEEAGGLRTLARVDYRAPFFKGGDKRRSLELLKECLRRYPQNSLAMLYLADSYLALGRRDEAREQLEKILKLCPDPEYGPEQLEYQEEARARLAKLIPSGKKSEAAPAGIASKQ